MKIIFLLVIAQMLVPRSFAQKSVPGDLIKHEVINAGTDKQEYQGYSIRLQPEGAAGFSFYLSKDNKIIPHHFQNPLPFSAKGIEKKEDAYKIAQWIINQYLKTGHWENTVPPHIVRQLGIQSN